MAVITGGPKLASLVGFTGTLKVIPIPAGSTRLAGGDWITSDELPMAVVGGVIESGFVLSAGAYLVRVPGSKPVEIEVPDDDDSHDIAGLITAGPENPPASPWVHGNLSGRGSADQHPIAAVTGLQDAIEALETLVLAVGTRPYLTVAALQEETGTPAAMCFIDSLGLTCIWRPDSVATHDGVKWFKIDVITTGRYEGIG